MAAATLAPLVRAATASVTGVEAVLPSSSTPSIAAPVTRAAGSSAQPDLCASTTANVPSSPLLPSSSPTTPTSAPPTPARKRSATPSRTERRFACTHPGCEKAYTKPSRLAEHERTHTGERPHVCAECGQSYLRSTHLAAHMRTHKNPEDKAFACPRDGCGKRFWTATHLARHEVLHDAGEVHACSQCELTFPKTHFLREHVAAAHEPRPEDVRRFACEHDGCDMAFATRQQLKTHEKRHDSSRYTCSHPDHGDDLPCFPVWSMLQAHMREAHPPVCPHDECKGRVFKSAYRLREHLKVHEQRDHDMALQPDDDLPPVIAEALHPKRRRKRRRSEREEPPQGDQESAVAVPISANDADGNNDPLLEPQTPSSRPRKLARIHDGETGKEWPCGAPGCGKAFKSKFYRDEHAQAAHTRARHRCTVCARAYRRPASLKRHVAEGWCGGNTPADTPGTPGTSSTRPGTPRTPRTPRTPVDEGALLTGVAHFPGGSAHRRWACPFVRDGGATCGNRFHRVYDVRRHLAKSHGVDADDMRTREMLLADGQTGDDE